MKTETARPGRAWAWFVLVLASANQLLFTLWHSIATGMPLVLAVAFGVVPVLLAGALSEIAARAQAGWALRALTFLVMVGTNAISWRGMYGLLYDYTGDPITAGLYPAVGEVAILLALYVATGPPRPAGPAGTRAEPVPEAARPDRSGHAGPYSRTGGAAGPVRKVRALLLYRRRRERDGTAGTGPGTAGPAVHPTAVPPVPVPAVPVDRRTGARGRGRATGTGQTPRTAPPVSAGTPAGGGGRPVRRAAGSRSRCLPRVSPSRRYGRKRRYGNRPALNPR
ncbi:hypothetical protein ACFQHO_53425 [Actinomadura yumaensis]|uniref:hypothetical protein n=1 Tax=Actinomadura yumaensis TaxID=111807 RepID=UPI0036225EB7